MSKIIKIYKEGTQVFTALPVDKIKRYEAVSGDETKISVFMDDGLEYPCTDLSDIATVTNYINANLFKPAAAKKTPVADQSK